MLFDRTGESLRGHQASSNLFIYLFTRCEQSTTLIPRYSYQQNIGAFEGFGQIQFQFHPSS